MIIALLILARTLLSIYVRHNKSAADSALINRILEFTAFKSSGSYPVTILWLTVNSFRQIFPYQRSPFRYISRPAYRLIG